MAVETVFTFGLGLMVAIGVITLFHQFRLGVVDDVQPDQAEMVASKLMLAMNSLKEIDGSGLKGSGRYRVDLPGQIAGRDYSLRLGRNLVVEVGDDTYSRDLVGFEAYKLSGGVPGGDVTVFKKQNKFILRSQ